MTFYEYSAGGGGATADNEYIRLVDFVAPSTYTNFLRKFVDGVPSDFQLDGTTPYIISGVVQSPDNNCCSISTHPITYTVSAPFVVPAGYSAYGPNAGSWAVLSPPADATSVLVSGFMHVYPPVMFPYSPTPPLSTWQDSLAVFDAFLAADEVARSFAPGTLAGALIPVWYDDAGTLTPAILVKDGSMFDPPISSGLQITLQEGLTTQAVAFDVPVALVDVLGPEGTAAGSGFLIQSKECNTGVVTQSFYDMDGISILPTAWQLAVQPAQTITTKPALDTVTTDTNIGAAIAAPMRSVGVSSSYLFDVSVDDGATWILAQSGVFIFGSGNNIVDASLFRVRPNVVNPGAEIALFADVEVP